VSEAARQLSARLDDTRPEFTMPLESAGTTFQESV
jgi:hypothetical protein